jgi:hypothetical protein
MPKVTVQTLLTRRHATSDDRRRHGADKVWIDTPVLTDESEDVGQFDIVRDT